MKFAPLSLFQNTKRSSEISRIEVLLGEISDRYFGELINLRADLNQPQTVPRQECLDTLKAYYFHLLNNIIARRMKEEQRHSSTNVSQAEMLPDDAAAEAIVTYFHEKIIALGFDQFKGILDALFNPTFNPTKNFDETVLLAAIPLCIASTIQEVVIVYTPKNIKASGDYYVPERIEDCLVDVLKKIDSLRENFLESKSSPFFNTSLRDLDTAIGQLKLQIALNRVDDFVRFPLRKCIGSSLPQDKLDIYVREKTGELVKHIVSSNGITIVTGYSGPGNSRFVNAALELPEIQQKWHQVDDSWQDVPIPVKVVPISVHLDGSTSFFNILQKCISELHRVLIEGGTAELLEDNEKKHLNRAHDRANRNAQEREADSSTRTMQGSAGVSTPNFPSPWHLPLLINGGAKVGLDKTRAVEWSRELPGYGDSEAEKDIIDLINLFARSEPSSKREGKIKLAFIFEGFNIDGEEKKRWLKRLIDFSERLERTGDVILLFVASYDGLQGLELNNVSKFVVPRFTAKEIAQLLKRLISIQEITSEQEKFIQDFAGYLTYFAQGTLPGIVPKLNEKQKKDSPTSKCYISASPEDRLAFPVYAQLQQALESLIKQLDISEIVHGESKDPEEQEEQRDHIQQILYKLVEKLLALEKLDLGKKSLNSTILQPDHFNALVKKLADILKDIEINNEKIFLLEPQDKDQSPTLKVLDIFYRLTKHSRDESRIRNNKEEEKNTLQNDIVRRLNQKGFARQLVKDVIELYRKDGSNLPEDIYTRLYCIFLTEGEEFRSEAAGYLNGGIFFKNVKNVNDEEQLLDKFIDREKNPQLLQAFINFIDEGANDADNQRIGTRLLLKLLNRPLTLSNWGKALSLLTKICDEDVLVQVMESLDKNLDRRQDINEDVVLKPLIALSKNSEKNLIGLLFEYNFTTISPKNLKALLSEQNDSQKELWSLISNAKNRKDKFERQIMRAISRYLPEAGPAQHEKLAVALKKIKSREDKFERQIMRAISRYLPEAGPALMGLQNMLKEFLSDTKSREDKFAQQIMVAILQELPGLDSAKRENLGKDVLYWLGSPDWEPAVDQATLRMAVYGNPQTDIHEKLDLLPILKTLTKQSGNEKALGRLDTTFPPTLSPAIQSSRASKREWLKKLIGGIAVLVALASTVIYFITSFDLPAHAILSSWLIVRSLEAIYISGGILGIIFLLKAILLRRLNRPLDHGSRNVFSILGLALLPIAIVCFLLQVSLYPLRFTFLGQLTLIGLLLPICLVLYILMSSKIDNLWRSSLL